MGKIYKNNVLYTNYTAVHSGFTPIGTVISVMSNHAPANYLICDGSVYNISAYPELANHFATEFGSKNYFGGDGTTTFAVPDLRGEFLRGTGTNSHANQGNGANVGEHQDGTQHIKIASDNVISHPYEGYTNIASINADTYNAGTAYHPNASGRDYTVDPKVGIYTSRPTNTSVLLCIAVKNIFMDAGSNYSTEEQVVGTWIDGKPLYQKTINADNIMSTAGEHNVAHNISNIDYIASISGTAQNSNGAILHLPYVDTTSPNGQIILSANRTNIVINNGIAYPAYSKIYVTIQYTKTTD